MKIIKELPEGYKRVAYVNLQKDKKTSVLINVISGVIALLMGFLMHLFVPITDALALSAGMESLMQYIIVLMIAMTAYIVLHEGVHAVFMKIFGCKKIKFGFTGLYAFAGTDELISKKAYFIIALAPVLVLGIILLILLFIFPMPIFWLIYLLEIVNVSGAVGDIFVTVKFGKMPEDIYIHDNGVSMNVYSKEEYVYEEKKEKEKEYEI